MAVTLDAIGNIGELIGSVGVLLSLVYLAVQIRRNTEAERTSTYQKVVSDFGVFNQTMAAHPDLLKLFVEGMENYDERNADEKARLSQMFFLCFHYFENMYYQHRKGYMEHEVWMGWKRLMLAYFERPGFQAWWRLRRGAFSESFAVFLETDTVADPLVSYFEVTRSEPPN